MALKAMVFPRLMGESRQVITKETQTALGEMSQPARTLGVRLADVIPLTKAQEHEPAEEAAERHATIASESEHLAEGGGDIADRTTQAH